MDLRRRGDASGHATVGVVLVIALVVVGTAAVVALGGQALRDTEDRSEIERAQQAMTLFDSQTARVALGESDRQTVRFGPTAGTYRVEPAAGEISIVNVDRDDDEDDISWTADGYPTDATAGDDDGDIEYIHNETLGAVVYESEGRAIAYQGGGVWQTGPDGAARVVSPPEFHLRGGTPMLPLVQVTGEGSASGSARAAISVGAFRARDVYPNATRAFPDGEPFANPVRNGSIVVRVESEYARAWGAYFESRTDGVVSYPSDGVVTVELVSEARVGEFDMPLEGSAVTVDGPADAHGVGRAADGETAFSIRLRPDDADSAKFSNLQWSLYAEEGDREFEMHLKKTAGGDDCSDGSTGTAADLTIYYSWNDGADYHGWKTTDAIEADCADLDGDGDYEIYFEITFVDDDDGDGTYDDDEGASDVALEFGSLSAGDLERFDPGGSLNGSHALDGHSAGWEPVSPVAGSTTLSSDQLVNHYFAELPRRFDLRVDDEDSDTVNEDASEVTFYGSGGGRQVTFLHVTETRLEIEL
ncbi:MAG: hypothetical protein V5A61_12735 [Haloarculaceae archaeon]